MIICEGENIHPAQVEAIINEHPDVENSIVVGIPDKIRGEALAAYIIKSNGDLSSKDLFKFLTENPGLSRFKRPRYIKFTGKIPLTRTGKKKYFVAKQTALEDL